MIPILFISILGLSLSPAAQQYYTAALSAMQMGDCSAAITWFEKALIEDPSIETLDPNVKLWMGICAYEIGDYAKAKDFLKLYPDNELARTILRKIEMGISPEEREWELIKSLISRGISIVQKPELPSTPSTAVEEGGKSPFLIFAGVFVVTFAALMILELKFALISSLLAKIPRIRIVIGEAEIKEVVHESMREEEEKEEEEAEEKEIEVDVEELFNSPLELVDKLIYGEEFEVEAEGEEKEEKKEEKEERTEMEMVTEELVSAEETSEEEAQPAVSSGEITEEEMEELEKRAKEILEGMEEEEEGVPLDIAGKSADEIFEELEEKEEYDEEDAEKIIYAIKMMTSGEEEEQGEEG